MARESTPNSYPPTRLQHLPAEGRRRPSPLPRHHAPRRHRPARMPLLLLLLAVVPVLLALVLRRCRALLPLPHSPRTGFGQPRGSLRCRPGRRMPGQLQAQAVRANRTARKATQRQNRVHLAQKGGPTAFQVRAQACRHVSGACRMEMMPVVVGHRRKGRELSTQRGPQLRSRLRNPSRKCPVRVEHVRCCGFHGRTPRTSIGGGRGRKGEAHTSSRAG